MINNTMIGLVVATMTVFANVNANAEIDILEMVLAETHVNACAKYNQFASFHGIGDPHLLFHMLSNAREKGASDYQLESLKHKYNMQYNLASMKFVGLDKKDHVLDEKGKESMKYAVYYCRDLANRAR